MKLRYEYSTNVRFAPCIGRHNLLLRCLPQDAPFQRVEAETFRITSGFWHMEGHDAWGNRIVTAGTGERHDALAYTCRGEVLSTTYCIPDASPHPLYRMPSALTGWHEAMLTSLPLLTGQTLMDALAIAHAVHRFVEYEPGTTHMLTRAEDVHRHRQGVCQDYAHLMIALCRAAGYPARYVCGLMAGEGVTHAWVEVHDGQCWYAFDPTNDTAIATGYIKLAHGRDAQDCPVSRGTYLGQAREETEVLVKVETIE